MGGLYTSSRKRKEGTPLVCKVKWALGDEQAGESERVRKWLKATQPIIGPRDIMYADKGTTVTTAQRGQPFHYLHLYSISVPGLASAVQRRSDRGNRPIRAARKLVPFGV